jgi:hypothetical protein
MPRLCGREFTDTELTDIRQCIAEHPQANRAQLSRMVCERLDWRRIDGRPKDMSCRVAMLRMHERGLIELPPPRKSNANGQPYRRRTAQAEPALSPITAPAGALGPLQLELIASRTHSHLWNEYIDRYHYLGFSPLPGAQLRYFVRAQGQILALLGFGAAAWKCAPRDQFINSSPAQREQHLHLVVNNARFLILPWVKSHNLASRILATAARALRNDWQQRYRYAPVMLETFVEVPRFRGIAYQAANWRYLGQTQGRGKLDVHHQAKLPKKAVWIYPLVKDPKRYLCC